MGREGIENLMALQSWINGRPKLGTCHLEYSQALTALYQFCNVASGNSILAIYNSGVRVAMSSGKFQSSMMMNCLNSSRGLLHWRYLPKISNLIVLLKGITNQK